MPRFFDDYSNTYLTHDSSAGRKQQRRGWKFRENFKLHYEKYVDEWRQGPMGLASAQEGFIRAHGKDHPAVPPLPDGWEEDVDEATGITFYEELSTGKRTWVRPGFIPPAPGRGPLPMMGAPPMGARPPYHQQQQPPLQLQQPPPSQMYNRPPPPNFAQPPPNMAGRPPPPPAIYGQPPPLVMGGGGPPPPPILYPGGGAPPPPTLPGQQFSVPPPRPGVPPSHQMQHPPPPY